MNNRAWKSRSSTLSGPVVWAPMYSILLSDLQSAMVSLRKAKSAWTKCIHESFLLTDYHKSKWLDFYSWRWVGKKHFNQIILKESSKCSPKPCQRQTQLHDSHWPHLMIACRGPETQVVSHSSKTRL